MSGLDDFVGELRRALMPQDLRIEAIQVIIDLAMEVKSHYLDKADSGVVDTMEGGVDGESEDIFITPEMYRKSADNIFDSIVKAMMVIGASVEEVAQAIATAPYLDLPPEDKARLLDLSR